MCVFVSLCVYHNPVQDRTLLESGKVIKPCGLGLKA